MLQFFALADLRRHWNAILAPQRCHSREDFDGAQGEGLGLGRWWAVSGRWWWCPLRSIFEAFGGAERLFLVLGMQLDSFRCIRRVGLGWNDGCEFWDRVGGRQVRRTFVRFWRLRVCAHGQDNDGT